MTRRLSLIFGILLALSAFIGVILLGSVLNPSPYRVSVAITEIQEGAVLEESMIGFDAQAVSPQVADVYILENELPDYLGKRAARTLLPGQPLMHYDFVAEGNPAAERRVALRLESPDDAVMVIPVDENAPEGILPGDRIAVVWSVGNADSVAMSYGYDGYGFGAGITGTGSLPGAPSPLPPEIAALLPEEVAAGIETGAGGMRVEPPLSKRIVSVAEVINVRREREPNPAFAGGEGESPYTEGEVVGLEIVVPIDELEAVQFAVANGSYSVAVLSPNADTSVLAEGSTPGVMWQDIKDYFAADRMRALGLLDTQGKVRPAGASYLYGAAVRSFHLPWNVEPMPGLPREESAPEETEPTPAATEEVTGTVVEVSPTPGPMPTATRVGEEAAVQPSPTPVPTEAPVMSMGSNLMLSAACAGGALLGVIVVVFLVLRAIRRRAPGAGV
ncbi:MAG TPA: hypothetical protein EYP77_00725 [Anaerolineae bacterium]|nr:hypothetical protein [Anaerolineae bacterium]